MNGRAPDLGPVVVLGVVGDERIARLDAALTRAGHAPARVLDYADFVTEPRRLAALFPAGRGVLRFESPGGGVRSREALTGRAVPLEASRLTPMRGFHEGFARVLAQAAALVPHEVVAMNDPAAITLFYDKARCHAAMGRHACPVPAALPPARSADELLSTMRAAGMDRVFVKPRFGSGAAGVAALAVNRGTLAVTSAAVLDGSVLHHGMRLRRSTGRDAMALIDALCSLEVHVERWAPKTVVEGRPADLRVLVVGGEIAQVVTRLGAGPITNLDLGAKRAEASVLRERATPAGWDAMLADCLRFAGLFPRQLYVAFDVAILAGGRRHVFFEANAFGDLLRRVRHEDRDPYETQIARFPAWAARLQAAAA